MKQYIHNQYILSVQHIQTILIYLLVIRSLWTVSSSLRFQLEVCQHHRQTDGWDYYAINR